MKIRITNGMNRRDVELPMSDSELSFHMKQIGVDGIIPKCKLIEVWDKGNSLAPFIGQTVNMDELNFFAKRMESLTDYERNDNTEKEKIYKLVIGKSVSIFFTDSQFCYAGNRESAVHLLYIQPVSIWR